MAWQWFTDPAAREAAPEAERDEHSRTIVADLRAAWARRRNDADMRELVEGLLEHSREFAELWARHEVAVRRMQRKTFLTRVGAITLDCEVLATTDGQTPRDPGPTAWIVGVGEAAPTGSRGGSDRRVMLLRQTGTASWVG